MAEPRSLLEITELDAIGERMYMHVVIHGRATVAAVAAQFGIDDGEVLDRLERLRALGLVTRLGNGSPEYSAVDPRVALRAIIDRLTDQALRIREAIPALAEYFDTAESGESAVRQVLVLTDPDAVAAWYARFQHEARREFLAFDRPPYVSASFDPFQAEVLARGVDWKAIYTIDSFDGGATWDEVVELAAQGEQARITDQLPLKLAIVDGEAALVSLTLEPGRIDALVTYSPPLVAALRELFGFHWSRATPLAEALPGAAAAEAAMGATGTAQVVPATHRRPTSEERSMLTLMAVGMKDESIARQLGISARTLRRRTQDLLGELDAGNRFQAGAEAARRGWI
jgi:DNA-binding NarL/FixJ family response regulator